MLEKEYHLKKDAKLLFDATFCTIVLFHGGQFLLMEKPECVERTPNQVLNGTFSFLVTTSARFLANMSTGCITSSGMPPKFLRIQCFSCSHVGLLLDFKTNPYNIFSKLKFKKQSISSLILYKYFYQ